MEVITTEFDDLFSLRCVLYVVFLSWLVWVFVLTVFFVEFIVCHYQAPVLLIHRRDFTVSLSSCFRDSTPIVLCQTVVAWCSGSVLVLINKVNLHQARLLLGLVTVSGFSSRCWSFILVCNQPPRSTQPGHHFVVRCIEYQPKGSDVLWLGRKASMVHTWAAGNTQAISECFRYVAW